MRRAEDGRAFGICGSVKGCGNRFESGVRKKPRLECERGFFVRVEKVRVRVKIKIKVKSKRIRVFVSTRSNQLQHQDQNHRHSLGCGVMLIGRDE